MSDFVPVPPLGGHGHDNNRRQHYGPGGGRGGGGRGGGRGGGWRGGSGAGRGQGRGQGRGRGRGGRGRGRQQQGRGGGRPWNKADEIFEEFGTPSDTSLSIAVQGCCHGELQTIYARILEYQQQTGRSIDLLICCGDFQSLRTHADFHSFAAPPKYRQLGSFVQYYSGAAVAPILTIFVGGNHENSQQLQELYYGGWVAPNIYYMGAAGIVTVKGVRIGGISGIYKSHDYQKGHFERPPYDRSTLRSVYHVRNLEVYRMKCLDRKRQPLDVMISHDWPQGIEAHGNTNFLLKKKPYFREEVRSNTLGSPANKEVLDALQPKFWFAAHLHVGFRATVKHDTGNSSETNDSSNNKHATAMDLVPSQTVKPAALSSPKNEQEETIGNKGASNDNSGGSGTNDNSGSGSVTKVLPFEYCQPVSETRFVSLDKCLPGRPFLSVSHIEPSQASDCKSNDNDNNVTLTYDPEWLAILRKTHGLTEPNNRRQQLPNDLMPATDDEILEAKQLLLESRGSLAIPQNFSVTVPAANGPAPRPLPGPLSIMGNSQTDEILGLLKLEHILTVPYDPECLREMQWSSSNPSAVAAAVQLVDDENEIDIDGDDADEGEVNTTVTGYGDKDQNEIDLDDEVNEDAMHAATTREKSEVEMDHVDDEGAASGGSPKRPRLDS
jgi:lariat debranching enzyme